MTSKNPEPYISIGAQALVKDSCKVHCGMVRKENKLKKWQDRYLVLHKGCLYYYKDSNDKRAQGQFSLSGYRLSKAPEKKKHEWTFKLTHIQPEKRAYYFAAHSEKELNEWIEKIHEDMSEYCEIRRPANLAHDDSGEITDDHYWPMYDYPLFVPEEMDALTVRVPKETNGSNVTPSNEATYCPPTDIFTSSHIKPMPQSPLTTKAQPQTTVDISKVVGKGAHGGINNPAVADLFAKVLTSVHPKPPLRTRPSDETATSPPSSHRPALLPKPQKTVQKPGSAGEEMYLELKNGEEPSPRLSTLQRKRPDGISFKSTKTEAFDVLPPTAFRLDLNRTNAIPLLSDYDGAYMIHSSRKGDINQALSVCIGDNVKHFLIFCNEEQTEYSLDHKATFFDSIDSMLRYYYKNPLPNQGNSALLRIPYK